MLHKNSEINLAPPVQSEHRQTISPHSTTFYAYFANVLKYRMT